MVGYRAGVREGSGWGQELDAYPIKIPLSYAADANSAIFLVGFF